MGMGHVPQDATGAEGARAELQRSQHRRVASQHDVTRGVARARANRARAHFAEDLVAEYYLREGYDIVARNWRCARGELDVVALRDGVLVVCEVKARRNADFGDPFDAITPRKVLRLRRAVAAYVESLSEAAAPRRFAVIRFDAAAVVGSRVEVREGAF